MFADSGVMAIEHADFDGIERLALVLGGEIVSTFEHPEMVKVGHCDLIEEIMIGKLWTKSLLVLRQITLSQLSSTTLFVFIISKMTNHEFFLSDHVQKWESCSKSIIKFISDIVLSFLQWKMGS